MYIMLNNRKLRHTLCRWILLAITAGVFGTSAFAAERDERIAKIYEDALARFERKDFAGTEVQLKNALQLNPRYLPGQVLLGKTQLSLGKSIDAEKSLKSAIQLGVDRSEVIHLLGQALFDQGKFQNVVELDPSGLSPKARIDILTLRAYAQIELGNFQEASRAVDAMQLVNAQAPGIPTALATIALRQNKLDEFSGRRHPPPSSAKSLRDQLRYLPRKGGGGRRRSFGPPHPPPSPRARSRAFDISEYNPCFL